MPSKRREWTKSDIRELKTMARSKTPAGKIARALTMNCDAFCSRYKSSRPRSI